MYKVHILGWKKGCFSRHLHPIRVFDGYLRDIGIEIQYFTKPLTKNIENCDLLIFMEAGYRNILPIPNSDRSYAIDFLSSFLNKFEKVVWFDDHDSSGMLRTYIFPLVTNYAKAQLSTDVSYYQQEHLMGIPHLDYVNEKFLISDTKKFKGPITNADIDKLHLSWNLGMINWAYMNSNNLLYRHFFYKNRKNNKVEYFTKKLSERNIPLTYRVGMWNNMPTVNWWRTQTAIKINKVLLNRNLPSLSISKRVDKAHYHEEMKNSVITPSPFGLGEICYRDFECFMNGSLLFKPNMGHLRTYPNLFIEGVTYISHSWDFSDFTDKLETILAHPYQYEDIAREGQKRFREALKNGEAFAEHFKTMISA